MPKVILPLFAANTRIDDALDQLRDVQPAAAAVFQDDDLRLITIADLAIARFNQIEVVGNVPSTASPRADEPIHIWTGRSADLTYSMHLGRFDFKIMTPGDMDATTLKTSIASQWLSGRWSGPVTVKLTGRPGGTPLAAPVGLDDLVQRRFEHPWANVWLDDVVWGIVSAPPRDYYCNGMPRHDRFVTPVQEGDICPRGHNPPAYIVRGR